MATPLALFTWFSPVFMTTGSTVNAGGSLEFFEAGVATPATYCIDEDGTPGGTSLTLDSDGRPTTQIFLKRNTAYTVVEKDSDDVELRSAAYVADPASLFLQKIGYYQAQGSKSVSSLPYTVDPATDNYVTVDAGSSGDVALPSTTDWLEQNGGILYVVNESNTAGVDITVVADGSDTINNSCMIADEVVLPAVEGVTPLLPSGVGLITTGNGNWLIISIFGLANQQS